MLYTTMRVNRVYPRLEGKTDKNHTTSYKECGPLCRAPIAKEKGNLSKR